MSYICPECGHECSDYAKECPQCHRPNFDRAGKTLAAYDKQDRRKLALRSASDCMSQVKLGLILFALAAGLTYLGIQCGMVSLQSQSFIGFLTNPNDWFAFGITFIFVSYITICILIAGSILGGLLLFGLILLALSWIFEPLPEIVQIIAVFTVLLLPIYLLWVRPVYMLIKAGYFRLKSKAIVDSEEDIFYRSLAEYENLGKRRE